MRLKEISQCEMRFRSARAITFFVVMFVICAGTLLATDTVLTVVADAEIDQHVNYRDKNLGSLNVIRVEIRSDKYKNPVVSPQSQGLLKWDLSAIPKKDVVTGAILQIQQADADVGKVKVYSIDKGDWSEDSVTWRKWVETKPELTLLGEMKDVPVSKGVTTFRSSKLTKLVQGWVDGTHANLGLLIKWSDKVGKGDSFLSREHKGDFIKPRLIISHAAAGVKSGASNGRKSEFSVNPARAEISGKPLRNYTGVAAPVMDLDYDFMCYKHTPETLADKMRLLADCGFKRIYIVAPPPGRVDYSSRINPNNKNNHLLENQKRFGDDALRTAVSLAKEVGLEVFVQYKPYEGGGVFTVPKGFTPPAGRNWMESLGGRAIALDPFLLKHPETRPMRKAVDARLSLPIDRLEMVFVLARIPGREKLKVENGRMSIQLGEDAPAIPVGDVKSDPPRNFVLYVSDDNGRYKPYPGVVKATQRIERRLIRDANGELAFPGAVLCRVIEITGFKISTPYLAVSFVGDPDKFRTIPYSRSCFKAFSGDMELPVTVSDTPRPSLSKGEFGFTRNGFEFEPIGPYYWDIGWKKGTLFAFARGREPHQRGSFCEAYPEVRRHWLNQIEKFLAMGCDGIDIRMMSHSSGISDFTNYVYNPPLVKAYEKRYGVDLSKSPPEPVKMMRLRGDFFLEFLREAAKIVHARGKILQAQVCDSYEHPTLDPTFPHAGFWAAVQVVPDWRKMIEIADEISVKDYNWGSYDPYKSGAVKTAVAALGKPLWVHCYLQQGHDLNERFLSAVERDKRVTGLMLYEVVYRPGNVNDGIVEITDSDEVRLVPGSPIQKMLTSLPSPIARK